MILELSLSMLCPLLCEYCPQTQAKANYDGPRLMSMHNFKTALKHIPSDSCISFAGLSEPYLNRDCTSMLQIACQNNRDVRLFTTGVGMDRVDAENVSQLNPKVTIHLPDRQGKMKYKPTAEYVSIIRWLATAVKDINFICHGVPPDSLVSLPYRDMLMQDRAGNVDANSLGLTVLNIKGPVGCRPAPNLDHPVMLPDGRLLLCCQMYSMEEIIGNIVDQTWDEIYNDAPLADIRKRMNDGEIVCRSCCYAERK